MNHFFKTLCLAGSVTLLTTQTEAQQSTTTTESKSQKEIIIRKKTDADAKVTIEINGENIRVNGKPLSEFDDKNIDVDVENLIRRLPGVRTTSPFRGGTLSLDRNEPLVVTGYGSSSNRAQLGVVTEKTDDGAKVKTVTKGSAAEKAGIKEGDVISKINDMKIESPDDLSKAVAKYKPEEKVDVRVKRGRKEEKLTATLGKTSTFARTYSQNMEFNSNGNNMNWEPSRMFNDNNLKFGQPDRIVIGSPSPKLGLYAQDTEDGKGVKVLGVDEGSIAQKAGLKEGDLITEFDGKAVNDATELMQASRTEKDKNNMKIKMIRDGKTQDLEIKIPKKLKTASL